MFRKWFSFIATCLLFHNVAFATPMPEISADGAFLIETNTNTILYAKNCTLPFYPASTTKVLTSLAIAKDLSMSEVITKSQDAVNEVPSDSSQIGLNVGDQYTVYDGLHAVLMSSDNFVCHDLALADSGSIAAFANKMNTLATQLGATNSHFVNPHGYHDEDHYTTPASLAQITQAAFDNPIVSEIAGTLNYDFTVLNTGEKISLQHTAALLNPSSPYYNKNVIAAKTGYHTPAKRTLVAKASYGPMELVGVVMRTDAPLQFEDMNKLFEYGSENFILNTEVDGTKHLQNLSYSPWAKPYIEEATTKGWIKNISYNYEQPITKRTFLTLLKDATPAKYNEIIDSMFCYNGSSIYIENLFTSRQEIATVIYNYLSTLDLMTIPKEINITDINTLPSNTQEAINFCVQSHIINLKNDNLFMPEDTISYEEAICIISKINGIIERYENFSL